MLLKTQSGPSKLHNIIRLLINCVQLIHRRTTRILSMSGFYCITTFLLLQLSLDLTKGLPKHVSGENVINNHTDDAMFFFLNLHPVILGRTQNFMCPD